MAQVKILLSLSVEYQPAKVNQCAYEKILLLPYPILLEIETHSIKKAILFGEFEISKSLIGKLFTSLIKCTRIHGT